MPYTQEIFAAGRFWRRIPIAGAATTLILDGVAGQRPVLHSISVSGVGGGGASVVGIRSETTETAIAYEVHIGTGATAQFNLSDVVIPMVAGEGVEVNVAGGLADGSVTISGRWVDAAELLDDDPAGSRTGDPYTGIP